MPTPSCISNEYINSCSKEGIKYIKNKALQEIEHCLNSSDPLRYYYASSWLELIKELDNTIKV